MSREDIERLQHKIAKDPDSKLFVPLAEEYKKAGMVDEAINILVQGLEKQPNYLSARVSLGKIFMGKGLLNEAKDEFQKVISIISDNLYAHKKLAEIYRELGERDKTINELKIVLNLNPADEWAISSLSEIEKELQQIPEEPPEPEITEHPAVPPEVIGKIQEELEAPTDTILSEEETPDRQSVEEEIQSLEAKAEEPAPVFHDAVLDAEHYIKQGNYHDAFDAYKTILSEDPENRQVLQRMAELKALFKLLGRDQEAHITQLENFLEGIKKRRNEFFGSTEDRGGHSG
jgi:tetratricopeptide (TPR) repeat protein